MDKLLNKNLVQAAFIKVNSEAETEKLKACV